MTYIYARRQRGANTVRINQIPYVVEAGVAALSEFDQIVLVGNQIPIPTFSYKGKPLTKVPEGCEIRTLATVDCDILDALTRLAETIGATEKSTDRCERQTVEQPIGALSPLAIDQAITNLMPENAIVADEALLEGFGFLANTEGAAAHDHMLADTGGAIGNGLPFALGASVACPDRKVICLSGDFSMMLCNMTLWSIANQNADMCIINYNNGGSASLEMELARVRPGDAAEKSLDMLKIRKPDIDYVQMSQSMGVPASRATTAEEFYSQFANAMETKGPHFIDAHIESTAPATIKMIRDNLVL